MVRVRRLGSGTGRGLGEAAAGPRRREERDWKAEGGLAGSHHFFRLELLRPERKLFPLRLALSPREIVLFEDYRW